MRPQVREIRNNGESLAAGPSASRPYVSSSANPGWVANEDRERRTTTSKLSPDWQQWVAENKLQKVPDEQIIAILVRSGFDHGVAAQEVQAVANHPYFRLAERTAQQ
jgi:hypothetical protein